MAFNKWKVNKDERVNDEGDEKVESKKKIFQQNTSVTKKTDEKEAKKEIKKETAGTKTSMIKNDVSDKKLNETKGEDIKKENVRQKRKNSNSSIEDEKEAKKQAIEIKKKPESEGVVNKKVILKGVIFALSGFQNPERGDLRDLALKIGAKYKPDWDKDCTHLM